MNCRWQRAQGRLTADGWWRLSCPYIQLIMCRRLGSCFLGVDRVVISVNDVVIDSVLDVTRVVGRAEDPLVVGLVFGEQQRDISLAVQIPLPQIGVRHCDDLYTFRPRNLL